jgi:hypothetical protein
MQIEQIALTTLLAVALLPACHDTTDPMGSATRDTGFPALDAANSTVDPGALTPAPSLVGATAECRADGRWIVCHTTASTDLVNEPITDFGLPCGTIYETSTDVRYGIRWYDAADSVIRKRHVRQDVAGFWSLSPDGSGPVVRLTIHANWYDSGYTNPLDLDSGVRQYHGMITANAPGTGNIGIIAGHDEPDGTHHGVLRGIDDPAVAANLCAALTP